MILAALALHAAGVCAQAGCPAKSIQVVVPYPPGGSNDLFARAVGKRLAESLGQPVLIDNRAGAGSLNYATSGAGSINHFATELLKMTAGVNLTHVPYKGMGPAVNDLVGGHVDLIIASAGRPWRLTCRPWRSPASPATASSYGGVCWPLRVSPRMWWRV